ncbi:hypothetical protein LINPERPRIM_LOCUS6358, partial [Linum perenne]
MTILFLYLIISGYEKLVILFGKGGSIDGATAWQRIWLRADAEEDLVTSGGGGGSGYERRRWRIWLRAAKV